MSSGILETRRLVLRELGQGDGPFIRGLVNDSDWIRYIGDRGVRSDEDARRYLERGPLAMYARLGFGLWLVERKADREPTGICGLIKRASLEDVDLGFAFLPAFRGEGYAFEAALTSRDYGIEVLGLERLVAITSPANAASARLLERLGFAFERIVGPVTDPVRLFAFNA